MLALRTGTISDKHMLICYISIVDRKSKRVSSKVITTSQGSFFRDHIRFFTLGDVLESPVSS